MVHVQACRLEVSCDVVSQCVGTIPTPAHGWVTAEHIRIGEASYHKACAYFRHPDVVHTAEQRLLAARFCFQDATLARHYGELTAYGGNYAAKPEDIPTDFAEMSARLEDLAVPASGFSDHSVSGPLSQMLGCGLL